MVRTGHLFIPLQAQFYTQIDKGPLASRTVSIYLIEEHNGVQIACRPLVSVHISPRYLFAVANQSEAVAVAARSCPLIPIAQQSLYNRLTAVCAIRRATQRIYEPNPQWPFLS